MVMLRNEADAQNKLQDEIDAILTDLNLASYIDAGINAIIAEFPFSEECAELYNCVSFAGQDRAALISLIALSTTEVLRRVGRHVVPHSDRTIEVSICRETELQTDS